jgi:hypothetical protein
MATVVTETNTGQGKAAAVGRVARVTGPVVDVEFASDNMPDMYNALTVDRTLGDASHRRWDGPRYLDAVDGRSRTRRSRH